MEQNKNDTLLESRRYVFSHSRSSPTIKKIHHNNTTTTTSTITTTTTKTGEEEEQKKKIIVSIIKDELILKCCRLFAKSNILKDILQILKESKQQEEQEEALLYQRNHHHHDHHHSPPRKMVRRQWEKIILERCDGDIDILLKEILSSSSSCHVELLHIKTILSETNQVTVWSTLFHGITQQNSSSLAKLYLTDITFSTDILQRGFTHYLEQIDNDNNDHNNMMMDNNIVTNIGSYHRRRQDDGSSSFSDSSHLTHVHIRRCKFSDDTAHIAFANVLRHIIAPSLQQFLFTYHRNSLSDKKMAEFLTILLFTEHPTTDPLTMQKKEEDDNTNNNHRQKKWEYIVE